MPDDRTQVIVSIATIPSRIAHIEPTLESLLSGKRIPDLIVVNTPRYCELEKSDYDIPAFLTGAGRFADKVRHVWSDRDWGPGTKILGPLGQLPHDDAILIIADDDVIYDAEFVSGLVDAQIQDHASSFSFHTYRTHGLSVGQGCDGVSFWSPNLQGIEEFAQQHVVGTPVLYHDDIWIAFFLASKGVKVRKVPVPESKQLVYQQILPNTVLSGQTGNLKRDLITKTQIPRLFGAVRLPFSSVLKMRSLHVLDSVVGSVSWFLTKSGRLGRRILSHAR